MLEVHMLLNELLPKVLKILEVPLVVEVQGQTLPIVMVLLLQDGRILHLVLGKVRYGPMEFRT